MNEWECRICTYNVMLSVPEPIRFNGQYERATRIPGALKRLNKKVDTDIIIFVELMDEQYINMIRNHMYASGWVYTSDVHINKLKSVKLANSGIFIVSKYPIIYQFEHTFQSACDGYDCNAAKGALYCRILKNNNIINIIGTHLQAWNSDKCVQTRLLQAQELNKFVSNLRIPRDEPIIVAGDFNVDQHSNMKELSQVLQIMNLNSLPLNTTISDNIFTVNPQTNKLVGNDDDTMYSTPVYPYGCYDEYMEIMTCKCCPQELLDYITYSRVHLQPVKGKSFTVVNELKTLVPFKMNFNITTTRGCIYDLSDHYPVIGILVFSSPTPFENRNISYTTKPREQKLPYLFILIISVLLIVVPMCIYLSIIIKTHQH